MISRLRTLLTQGRSTKEVEEYIENYVFGEKNRQIIKRLVLDEKTYEDVADEVGMSPRGVYYRVERICNKLAEKDR